MPLPEIIGRSLIHKGRKFDFESLTIRQPSGRVMTREIVKHPGAVVIVPVLPDGRVVLIRVFRISLGKMSQECCAGTREAGEDPAECAARELIEETGFKADRLVKLATFFTSPGLSDEAMHAFVATGLTHVGQDLEEDEHIEVELVAAAEVLQRLDRGEIADGKSMVALLLAQRQGWLAPSGPPGP